MSIHLPPPVEGGGVARLSVDLPPPLAMSLAQAMPSVSLGELRFFEQFGPSPPPQAHQSDRSRYSDGSLLYPHQEPALIAFGNAQ